MQFIFVLLALFCGQYFFCSASMFAVRFSILSQKGSLLKLGCSLVAHIGMTLDT